MRSNGIRQERAQAVVPVSSIDKPFTPDNDEPVMKRMITNRWTQLGAAMVLLAALAASFTGVVGQLPPHPRSSLQLDHNYYALHYNNVLLRGIRISPDGKLLVSMKGSETDTTQVCEIVLWDLETGTRRWSGEGDLINLRDVEFSPDSKLLAAKSKGYHIKIWDTEDGRLRLDKELEHDRHEERIIPDDAVWTGISPDSRFLLIDDHRSRVIFWDLATNQEWACIDGSYDSLRFAPDGRQFAISTAFFGSPIHVMFWDVPEGNARPRLVKQKEIVLKDSADCVPFVISPDLQTCAFADTTRLPHAIHIWDLSTNEEQATLLQRHTELGHLQFDVAKRDFSLGFSPDGRFVMATFEGVEFKDGGLVVSHYKHLIWNAQGELQARHVLSDLPQVSPCGRWLLLLHADGADVWEADTLRQHADLRRQTDHDPGRGMGGTGLPPWPTIPASEYQFSPDGRFVLVTGFETTRTPNLVEMVFTGQWNRINKPETVSVTRLWDVERGEEIMTFYDCTDAVFSPDGRTLATVQSDNSVHFWTVPPRRPIGLILALTTATGALALLCCWAVKRWLRRGRPSAAPANETCATEPPTTTSRS
jgi:WD40 repeat protein